MKKLLLIASIFLLSACGAKLDGTYSDPSGMANYTFKSNGKVTMSAMGAEVEMDYKVEDGKVKIGSQQGTIVMPILDDGSIQGPMGVKLTKK